MAASLKTRLFALALWPVIASLLVMVTLVVAFVLTIIALAWPIIIWHPKAEITLGRYT